jgi:hypothetical protein
MAMVRERLASNKRRQVRIDELLSTTLLASKEGVHRRVTTEFGTGSIAAGTGTTTIRFCIEDHETCSIDSEGSLRRNLDSATAQRPYPCGYLHQHSSTEKKGVILILSPETDVNSMGTDSQSKQHRLQMPNSTSRSL